MMSADWAVLGGSVGFLGAFYWWFFGSSREGAVKAAVTGTGVQEIEIVVKGGYSPDSLTVKQGVPVRLNFRREESGECTDRVVIPDFRISQPLPAFTTTPVEFTPTEPGRHEFVCGMGMVHGSITVEP